MASLFLLDIATKDVANMLRIVEVNDLDDYYKYLKCSCIDVARRKIGDKYFDIWVDDEGLLVENPEVSAIDESGNPMLFGNLLISNHDMAGNTVSVSEDDIDIITNNIFPCIVGGKFRYILKCEY